MSLQNGSDPEWAIMLTFIDTTDGAEREGSVALNDEKGDPSVLFLRDPLSQPRSSCAAVNCAINVFEHIYCVNRAFRFDEKDLETELWFLN